MRLDDGAAVTANRSISFNIYDEFYLCFLIIVVTRKTFNNDKHFYVTLFQVNEIKIGINIP